MTVLDIGLDFPGGPISWVPLGSTVEQALNTRLARMAATASAPTTCFFILILILIFIFISFFGSTASQFPGLPEYSNPAILLNAHFPPNPSGKFMTQFQGFLRTTVLNQDGERQ